MSFTSVENLNRMGSVLGGSYDQASSFPVVGLKGVGFNIINNDAATDLILKITGDITDETYTVPAGGTLNGLTKPFSELAITQATAKYNIIVNVAL